MRPESLAVIGLGAIGGSLAWQARLAGIPRVIGYAAEPQDRVQALKSAAVHDVTDSARRAVEGAQLVVLATPPRAVLGLLEQLGSTLPPGAIVTDVASIKQPVMLKAREAGLGERFAGSHPFAGTHQSGWSGARPDLLTGAIVYVCATGPEGESVAREIMNFWESVIRAHPVRIDAEVHDTQLAWTSHLPQAVASVLARTLASEPSLGGASLGTGARDTTRLAASPAEMWVDIFLLNREPVSQALARAEDQLAQLRELIRKGDRSGLLQYLEEGATFRRRLSRDSSA